MSVEHFVEGQQIQVSWQDKLTKAARRQDVKLRKTYHRPFMRNGYQDVKRISPKEVDEAIIQRQRHYLWPLRPIDIAREIASTIRYESNTTNKEVAIANGVVLPIENWEYAKTINPEQLIFEPNGFTIYVRDASK